MLWEPYIRESVIHIPDICFVHQEIWQTMPLLICFETVEWHHPERVLYQFDLHQGIPPSCSLEQKLYLADKIGQHKYNWETYHAQYVALWATCVERIVTSPPMVGIMDFHCKTREILISGKRVKS